MGGFVNGRLKRGNKDIHPSIINQVSLWALKDVTVRKVGSGKEKAREKKWKKKRERQYKT